MTLSGYDLIILSAVLITGSALLFGKAYLWPSLPEEIAATYYGGNPFQIRNTIIQRYESLAGAVWLVGSLLAFIIGTAQGEESHYLIDRWLDPLILLAVGCLVWVVTIALTKNLSRRRYLPRMVEVQREVFAQASSVIENDGRYRQEIQQSSSIDQTTRQQRLSDATRQLDQIGKLIDLPRMADEADAKYLNRIKPSFVN